MKEITFDTGMAFGVVKIRWRERTWGESRQVRKDFTDVEEQAWRLMILSLIVDEEIRPIEWWDEIPEYKIDEVVKIFQELNPNKVENEAKKKYVA